MRASRRPPVFIDLLFGRDAAFGSVRDFLAPTTILATDIPAMLRADAAPKTVYTDSDLVISAIAGHHRDAPAPIFRIDFAGKSITFSGDFDAECLPPYQLPHAAHRTSCGNRQQVRAHCDAAQIGTVLSA